MIGNPRNTPEGMSNIQDYTGGNFFGNVTAFTEFIELSGMAGTFDKNIFS